VNEALAIFSLKI